MKRAKNSPIGEVECPHKGCTKTCSVFKFRPRTEGHKSVFSNKHYAECPVHGRIGSDGSSAINEYILERGTIWGANRPASAPDAGPEKPAKNSAPAQPARVRTAPATKPASAGSFSGPTSSASSPIRPWWQPLID